MTNNNNNINELMDVDEFLASLGIIEVERKGTKNKMKNKKQKVNNRMKYNSKINKSNVVNDEFLLSL